MQSGSHEPHFTDEESEAVLSPADSKFQNWGWHPGDLTPSLGSPRFPVQPLRRAVSLPLTQSQCHFLLDRSFWLKRPIFLLCVCVVSAHGTIWAGVSDHRGTHIAAHQLEVWKIGGELGIKPWPHILSSFTLWNILCFYNIHSDCCSILFKWASALVTGGRDLCFSSNWLHICLKNVATVCINLQIKILQNKPILWY